MMKYRIEPALKDQDMDWFVSMQFESMRENSALDLKKPENLLLQEHRAELLAFIQGKINNEILICKQEQTGSRLGYTWIAERGYSDPWDTGTPPAWIYDIRVSPEFRGQGLGKALVAAGCSWSRNEGFDRIGLHVNGNNHVAIHLYQEVGFETGHCYLQKQIPQKAEADHPAVNHYQVKRFDCDDDPECLLTLWYENFRTRLSAGSHLPEHKIRERFKGLSEQTRFDRPNTTTFIATSNGGNPAGFVQIYPSRGDLGEQEYTWMWVPEISPEHPKNEVIESLIQQVENWTRERGLEMIRTGPYIGNEPRDWLDNRGYQATNLFMFGKT